MDNTQTLVYVGQGSSFEMLGGAELTGNWNAGTGVNGDGGAVRVEGGVFRMTGDNTKIHHNYAVRHAGGLECLGGNGTFIMSGKYAEVSSNAAKLGPGGVHLDGPDARPEGDYFEMSGEYTKINGNQGGTGWDGGGIQLYGTGTRGLMSGAHAEISGNYAQRSGGAIYMEAASQFTMSGEFAAISGNSALATAGGVFLEKNAQFTMSGKNATISGNTSAGHATETKNIGGGVALASTLGTGEFIMSGENAAITNNTAAYSGGGVEILGGQFIMSGANTKISDNEAGSGGGVKVQGGQFTMSGANAKISGNEAISTNGGGVYVSSSSAHFTMSGNSAEISGNKCGAAGGGVYLYNQAQFTMYSGSIVNNTWSPTFDADGNFSREHNGGVSGLWPQGTKAYNGPPGSPRSSATQHSNGSSDMPINNWRDNLWAER
jgi:predicted outer membrane repeat protein